MNTFATLAAVYLLALGSALAIVGLLVLCGVFGAML